jgi:shikimate kinase
MTKNIILTGFMATGKSAVGKELAKRLDRTFVDTDILVEEKTARTISDIFRDRGEEYFRDLESEVIAGLVRYRPGSLVVATGGGAVIREKNRNLLRKDGVIVLLTASPRAILKRVGKTGRRPLLTAKCTLEEINKRLAEREPYYRYYDITVDTTARRPGWVAKEIIAVLRAADLLN